MILLKRNSSNTIIVTVSELTTVPDPVYYLFEFRGQSSNNFAFMIVGNNLSAYKWRYDKFTILETETPVGLNQVHLPQADNYTYKIYQQSSNTNIDPALSAGLVEQGFCYVNAALPQDITYIPDVEQNIVYQTPVEGE